MKSLSFSILVLLYFTCRTNAQYNEQYCTFFDTTGKEFRYPRYYTRLPVKFLNAFVEKIEVNDASSFSKLPVLKESLSEINKKLYWPEIAILAGVKGNLTIEALIGNDGNVTTTKQKKRIGAGVDENAENIIKHVKFSPAVKNGQNVSSKVTFYVTYSCNEFIDESTADISEILLKYECELSHFRDVYILKRDLSATKIEVRTLQDKKVEYRGRIDSLKYKRLCDFIMSQRFDELNGGYFTKGTDYCTTTISITINGKTKSLINQSGYGNVNLWAIENIIEKFSSEIDWRKEY